MTVGSSKSRSLIVVVLAVALVATAVRVAVLSVRMPTADIWRHMALVRNLQAGRGFVLFDEQPYIWYSPVWHSLAAALTTPSRIHWLAALLSALAAALLSAYLFRITRGNVKVALGGGLLMAAWGPAVWYTSQPGSEGLATFLLTMALLVSATSRAAVGTGLAGILFGTTVILRPPFVFNALLFGGFTSWRARLVFGAGTSIPLAAQWWRNHSILASTPFVFSWDGMATRSETYGPLSTLFVHLHPTISRALTTLHGGMRREPDWLFQNGDFRWEMVAFVAVAMWCIAVCRRASVIATALTTIGGALVLDRTGTMNFFRAWVGIFPVISIAVAFALFRTGNRAIPSKSTGFVVLAALLLTGIPELRRDDAISLEQVTPPAHRLSQPRYMVASGFYHPDALVWRFPERRFIGMPLEPEDFADFAAYFAGYRTILWHPVGAGIQAALFASLSQSDRYEIVERWRNKAHYEYLVMRRRPNPP